MRRLGALTLSLAGITLTILSQDTRSDAKKALSEEWRDDPAQCMKALECIFGASAYPNDALLVLGTKLNPQAKAVYKDASSYSDFWQLVVTAPTAPASGAAAAPARTKLQLQQDADAACASAGAIVDSLYANAQIPLLRKSLVRHLTNPVSAVYLLLAAIPTNDPKWPQKLADIRACAATDQQPNTIGTRLFDYVRTSKFSQ